MRAGLGEAALAVGTTLLVALAVGVHRPGLVVVLLAAVGGAVMLARRALPAAPHVAATLAVCIPIYTALFVAAVTGGFQGARPFAAYVCHLLPIVAFSGALWRGRARLDRVVSRSVPDAAAVGRGLRWIVLLALVGLVDLVLADAYGDRLGRTNLLLVAGVVAAALAWRGVDDLIVLLDATGRLFAAFVGRMARRLVPVFSFLVVYCLLVVLFAAFYAILDGATGAGHFSVAGEARPIHFGEALYFSMVTLSTIGYGDITAVSGTARAIVAAEIICGVVLVLFAFAEIAAYDPDAAAEPGGPTTPASDDRPMGGEEP